MKFLKTCLNYKVLIGVAVAILLAYLFAPQLARYSWLLLVLACPISMIVMMAGMQHVQNKPNSPKRVFVCPECGLQYADDSTSLITGKEWAGKCQAWCKEHKSCNLEIIKHSLPT